MWRSWILAVAGIGVTACGGDDGGGGGNCATEQYGAYGDAQGPRCGESSVEYVFCMPGDRCVDAAATLCEVVISGHNGIVCEGGLYDAYLEANGSRCGENEFEVTSCLPGDECADPASGRCRFVGSDGAFRACPGPQYDAFGDGDGPRCGANDVEVTSCMAGDRCVDAAQSRCQFVRSPANGTSCPDEAYEAFGGAGGPTCGENDVEITSCLPGDLCSSAASRTCS